MRIFWASPRGQGWGLAAAMRKAGDKVVLWVPDPYNDAGKGWLPRAGPTEWRLYAEKADLIIVDGNFQSRRTRRSWGPSRWVEELSDLRRDAPERYIGPVQTSELLENDPRYLKKVLKRFDIASHEGPLPEASIAVSLHIDAPGHPSVVIRKEGADWSVPIPPGAKLALSLSKLVEFLRHIKYRGPLAADLSVSEEAVAVRGLTTGFLYPAVCGGSLVSATQGSLVSVSTQLGRESIVDFTWNPYDSPVIGGQLAASQVPGQARVVGKMAGTIVSVGRDLAEAAGHATQQVGQLLTEGWTAPGPSGDVVPGEWDTLRSWRWIP
jgi:hypothetical protein